MRLGFAWLLGVTCCKPGARELGMEIGGHPRLSEAKLDDTFPTSFLVRLAVSADLSSQSSFLLSPSQRRAEDTDCLIGESGRIIRDAPVRSPARACYHRKTGRALRFALEHGAHRRDGRGHPRSRRLPRFV